MCPTITALVDKERIETFAAALRKWYRCADALFARSWCEILGRKGHIGNINRLEH